MPHESPIAIPYGGQAVIEGVMVRGPRAMSIAVREPGGQIVVQSEVMAPGLAASLRRVPFVRGVVTLAETFSMGTRALYWSSRVAAGRADDRIRRSEVALSVATLTAAAAVFVAGPVFLTGWLGSAVGHEAVEVVAEGTVRIAMLIGYIWIIGRLPEVQRVFAYHGAEHRAIHAREHGRPLTVESVREFRNEHPRCGTAFLLTVGVISFLTFMALGTPPLAERVLERAILMPVIAGVAYEFIRASQEHEGQPLVRLLQSPNLWLQKLTTRDPDDAQIEVAIAALESVMALEASLPEYGAVPVGVPVEPEEA